MIKESKNKTKTYDFAFFPKLKSEIALQEAFKEKPSAGPNQLLGNYELSVNIHQIRILNKLCQYLKMRGRSTDLLDMDGCCNGFTYLFLYYSARGMEDYFFETLGLISQWNEDELTLTAPLLNQPQGQYYQNLEALIEQWINDLIWFQSSETLKPIHQLEQYERFEQFMGIDGEVDYLPQTIYMINEKPKADIYGTCITREQIEEVLDSFAQMPIKTRLELGDEEHLTGAYINSEGKIVYYDSDFDYRVCPLNDIETFKKFVLDTSYSCAPTENLNFFLHLFYFKKDEGNFDSYDFFSRDELPKDKKTAKQFQDESPNEWTFLHAAIAMKSLPSLKQLLQDNHCNINESDRFVQTPIEFAIHQNFQEAAFLLLEHPDIELEANMAIQAYEEGMTEITQKILNHKNFNEFSELMSFAIEINNTDLVKQIIQRQPHFSMQDIQGTNLENVDSAMRELLLSLNIIEESYFILNR